MLRFWREITIVLLLAVVALGVSLWPEPKVQIVEKERVVEKTKTVTVTKTVTKKPDGTVIEETKESSKVSKTKSDKVDIAVAADPSRYSVILLSPLRAPMRPEVIVGAQIGNLPAEAFGAYDFESKAIKLGVGIRF